MGVHCSSKSGHLNAPLFFCISARLLSLTFTAGAAEPAFVCSVTLMLEDLYPRLALEDPLKAPGAALPSSAESWTAQGTHILPGLLWLSEWQLGGFESPAALPGVWTHSELEFTSRLLLGFSQEHFFNKSLAHGSGSLSRGLLLGNLT